jgi:hypothetical protein
MKKILTALAVTAGLMGSAHAFTVNVSSFAAATSVVNNDFETPGCVGPNCILTGYSEFATGDHLMSITGLSASDKLDFTAIGAEAAAVNSFLINGVVKFTETSWDSGHPQVELYNTDLGTFTVSSITSLAFSSSDGTTATLTGMLPSTEPLGIFFNPGDNSSIVLAFDDGAQVDDNHDDLLIRVSFVPEPAAWAFMILGFAGLAMARRRSLVRA